MEYQAIDRTAKNIRKSEHQLTALESTHAKKITTARHGESSQHEHELSNHSVSTAVQQDHQTTRYQPTTKLQHGSGTTQDYPSDSAISTLDASAAIAPKDQHAENTLHVQTECIARDCPNRPTKHTRIDGIRVPICNSHLTRLYRYGDIQEDKPLATKPKRYTKSNTDPASESKSARWGVQTTQNEGDRPSATLRAELTSKGQISPSEANSACFSDPKSALPANPDSSCSIMSDGELSDAEIIAHYGWAIQAFANEIRTDTNSLSWFLNRAKRAVGLKMADGVVNVR